MTTPATQITWSNITTAPATLLLFGLEAKLDSIVPETDRSNQHWELGGDGGPSAYERKQREISHLIGQLKRVHADLGRRRRHAHN